MNDLELLRQKLLVDSFLIRGPRPLSSFSFVSIFAWCDFFDFELKIMDDSLCIFAHGDSGSFLYLPPLGGGCNDQMIKNIFFHISRGGRPKPVNRIENIPENLLLFFDPWQYNHYRRAAEYLYRKADLIELRGHAYKSQRHDYNCFTGHHHGLCSFESYKDEDFNACMGLYECWAKHRASVNSDPVYQTMLQENRLVHGRLLRFSKPLGLVARVLKIQDEIVGYTFGYGLNTDTFVIYAEIVDLSIRGLSAFIFRNFCCDTQLRDFCWINTMDDFCLPRLAAAKQAYHPAAMVSSHTVAFKHEY